jgi:hypothetical protein
MDNVCLALAPTPGVVPLCKIVDWGHSKSGVLDSVAHSLVGTAFYMSPEVRQCAAKRAFKP